MITQKIFTDELEKRIDPNYYHPRFTNFFNKLKRSKHNLVNLSEITKSVFQGVGKNETKDNDITLLKVKNITQESGIDYEDVEYVKDVPESKLLETEDIISPFIGEATKLGKFALFNRSDGKYTVDNNTGVIRADKTKILPEYLLTVLSSEIGKVQIERLIGGGGVPFLGAGNAKLLQIPLPTIGQQREIALILQNALRSKEEKLKQADELLNSIDDFVRQQLGIHYQVPEEEKIYAVSSQDLENNRQDPYYHNPKFATTIKQLKAGKYPIETLGKFITEIRYGASVKNDYVDEGIPLLRIVNLKPNHIDLTDVVHLPKTKSKAIGNCYVYEDDLLISRSGTIGIVAVVPKEADGFAYGSFMIKFRLNAELDNNYVSVWLNSDISKLLVQRERIGAIQGNITIPTIQGFLLPVPPLDKQKEIASGVMEKYSKIENLKNEASKLLEEAKKKVEEMILN